VQKLQGYWLRFIILTRLTASHPVFLPEWLRHIGVFVTLGICLPKQLLLNDGAVEF
jgi:hypothetical protein